MASKETVNSHDESIIIEVDDSPAAAPRKSTRKNPWKVVDDDCTKLCEFPVSQSDTVTVSSQDYATLEHDTFLNDIIIDFYLTHLFYKVLTAEFRNSVHIFSTMFYKRLLQTPKKDAKKVAPFETDPSLSAKEKQHLRVAGWTKNVDLFSKDVVIVPICEHSHWYLVVVIKPGLVNNPDDSEKRTMDTREDLTERTDAEEKCEETTDSEEDSKERTDGEEDPEEKTDIPMDKIDTSEDMTAKGEPFFFVLDSLGGTKKSAVTNIQQYLACEWRSKKCCGEDHTQELQFSNAKMPTIYPKKPEQENWSDCGIFLLHYVEKIFLNLDNFLWPDLPDLSNWFTIVEVGKKRATIAVLIRKLAKQQRKRGEIPNFPNIKFKSESRTRKSPKLMDSYLPEEISPIRDVNENLHQKQVKEMTVTRSNSSKQVIARSTYSKKVRQEKSSKCSKTNTIAFKETEMESSEDFTFDPTIYSSTTTMCSDKPASSSNTGLSTSSSIATPSISSNTTPSSSHIAVTSAAPSHAAAMSSTSSAAMPSTSSAKMSPTFSAASSDGNPSSASNFASGAKANFMEVWNANKDNLVIGDYVRFASTSTAKKDGKVKKKRLGLETFKNLQLTSTDDRNTSLNNRSYAPEKYTDKK